MWSDNDIDKAFQRLDPPEPEPAPFPLDAWLRLETQLDQAVIARAVRRKLWRFFAAEVAVVALLALGWWLWPARPAAKAPAVARAAQPTPARPEQAAGAATPGPNAPAPARSAANVGAAAAPRPTAPAGVAAPTTDAALAGAALPGPRAALAAAGTPAALRLVAGPGASPRRRPYRDVEATAAPVADYDLRNGAATFAAGTRLRPARRQRAEAGPAAAAQPTGRFAPDQPAGAALGTVADNPARNPGEIIVQAAASPTAADDANAPTDLAGAPAPDGLDARAVALAPMPTPLLPAPLAGVATLAADPAGPAPARQPRFYLGVVGAPDVSTVRWAGVQSPLPNVGLTLEYRLTSRLRLSTGLLRSTKRYAARREDYDWGSSQYRAYQRDFQTVDGACTVLDVPLNLRYDLLVRPRYQVFGSAGVSSFFMQRERYSYDYVEYNAPKQWSWELVNENRHLGGILNLSAGYERRLGARWSAQAEPYLKLPLAGVGAGKVRLTSAGVFFGVKYGW